jgi:hypothetical protein
MGVGVNTKNLYAGCRSWHGICSLSLSLSLSLSDARRHLKKLILFAVFMGAAGFLSAQTADDLDTILNTREITYSQAALFIFAAAQADGPIDGSVSAYNLISADKIISLGEVSLLIMKSFGLKGGIVYTLFPNARHACRELVYLRIIQGRTDPGGHLNGREFLHILGRVLTYTGEDTHE